MKKKLVYLGFVIASVVTALKIFVDKVDEETEKAYQQAQDQLTKENLEMLRMLSPSPSLPSVQPDEDKIDESLPSAQPDEDKINKLKMPPPPPPNGTSQGNLLHLCGKVDLGTYFQLVARQLDVPLEAAAVIPRESHGFAYATGCDKCPEGKDGEKLREERQNKKSTNWQWVSTVFGKGINKLCLWNATMDKTCTVGFGLMQITSHTISKGEYPTYVKPSALLETRATMYVYNKNYYYYKADPAVKRSIIQEAMEKEPMNSPYHPCTNIMVGLMIFKEKYNYKPCKNLKSVQRIACAFCYYNGKPTYLRELRSALEGKKGLLVQMGFMKDEAAEGLKGWLIDIIDRLSGKNVDKCGSLGGVLSSLFKQ